MRDRGFKLTLEAVVKDQGQAYFGDDSDRLGSNLLWRRQLETGVKLTLAAVVKHRVPTYFGGSSERMRSNLL